MFASITPASSLRLFFSAALAVAAAVVAAEPVAAQESHPTIADKTEGMDPMEGFFNLYWDDGAGALYWELDLAGGEFLYQISMGSGLGSNPVGIDRGQLRGTHVLEAKRVGPRVLLMEPNYQFQARSDNPTEVQAVRDAFAPSVYWGFDIVARTGDRVLVDATPFFIRDARNAIGQIAQRGQGNFRLDPSRSAIHMPATRSFPENTEVESLLTFSSDNPGGLVRGVAVNPEAVTLRQHHSFIQLPDDGYRTRIADPRIGGERPPRCSTTRRRSTRTFESALPLRHRLQKRNPGPGPSEPVEPIVYYVDPGTPEPIRSALIDGAAAWWEEAFEAAGFIDAYRVEVLPEGRRSAGHPLQHDPLDAPAYARILIRQHRHRSAHRRDHPRRGQPRQPAAAAGLPARTGNGRAVLLGTVGGDAQGVVRSFGTWIRGASSIIRCHGMAVQPRGRAGLRIPGPGVRQLGRGGDGAGACSHSCPRTRGRPHHRIPPQLSREHLRARERDGLSRAVCRDRRRRQPSTWGTPTFSASASTTSSPSTGSTASSRRLRTRLSRA